MYGALRSTGAMPFVNWALRFSSQCKCLHRQRVTQVVCAACFDGGLACCRANRNFISKHPRSWISGYKRSFISPIHVTMAGQTDHTSGIERPQDIHAHTNRLAKEESPYLLQHQHNPVDWYPWGQEAFEAARGQDKPIFLSVGYSTCHWCHVMGRESFENDSVADLLNKYYISIKVDKEERPDVDRLYMTYVQATQGGGGWPMSVFLTPDLQPFLGGTYFPPEDGFGRPGFKTLLKRVAEVWAAKKDLVRNQAADTMAQLAAALQPEATAGASVEGEVVKKALEVCAHQLAGRFDEERGGFGAAPKFPRPPEISALLYRHLQTVAAGRTPQPGSSLHMALFTLQRMAAGGMYDHVGGGFHRYSVDEFWHVPHFEKMLYDNAQLVVTYLDAFRIRKDQHYSGVARGILDYLMRDMTHPEGGIYSAEDADSLDKAGRKKEGAFYLWTQEEIEEVLGRNSVATDLLKRLYYIKPEGNCDLSPRSDPHEEFGGLNCLIQRSGVYDVAGWAGTSESDAEATLAQARKALHDRRAQRPRPHLDDKVVTAWNGMSISAFALAGRVVQGEEAPARPHFPVMGREPSDYLQAAIRIAEFVEAKLWDREAKRLRRSFCRGPSAVQGFADDYAFMVQGLLDLYCCTGSVRWLSWALELQAVMDDQFWDPVGGGYYSTSGDDPSILVRLKEDYDGAEPAPTSIAIANLLRLAALAAPERAAPLMERARKAVAAFQDRLAEAPLAIPQMCCAVYLLSRWHLRQVVIAGQVDAPETQALLNAAHAPFAPDKVVILVDTSDAATVEFWQRHNPAVLEMAQSGGAKEGARAYVCQNFTCQAPTSDPQRVRDLLSAPATVFTPATGSATPVTVDLSTLMGGESS
eukprot:jgi/Botrbrau1/1900/Bobra.0005s0016.2